MKSNRKKTAHGGQPPQNPYVARTLHAQQRTFPPARARQIPRMRTPTLSPHARIPISLVVRLSVVPAVCTGEGGDAAGMTAPLCTWAEGLGALRQWHNDVVALQKNIPFPFAFYLFHLRHCMGELFLCADERTATQHMQWATFIPDPEEAAASEGA